MLGLSVGQVRAYVRAGFLMPARGPRRELRFSFQDLVLLRAAQGLIAAHIPFRKVRRALGKLREQIPRERPLTGLHISAEGEGIVVSDGEARWQPESGQVLFDFEVRDLARQAAPMARRAVRAAAGDDLSAEDWYHWGCDLEEGAPEEARRAYQRALELDPGCADAHVNLGRLLHEAGDVRRAQVHYQSALAACPDDATAAYNLGVALEDLGRAEEAAQAYEAAVAADPAQADAHFNAARVYEGLGRRAAALRHLRTYKKLTRG